MSNNLFQVTVSSLSYDLPNGDPLFHSISLVLTNSRYALVGPNGVGKSTLARILSGDLFPAAGEIERSHAILYLPQEEERSNMTIGEYLMPLWESPAANEPLWAQLVGELSLESPLPVLSGGEWMRVRLARSLAYSPGLLILDEPTNNLDVEARHLVMAFVRSYSSALLLISHDRQILREVGTVLELSNQGLSTYGGNYDFYIEQKEAERALQARKLDEARREKKKKEREYQERIDTQEKRMRRGAKLAERGGIPKILLGGMKRRAQVTAAKIQVNEDKRVDKSAEAFHEVWEAQKIENSLNLHLPDTSIPAGKLVFEILDLNFKYESALTPLWKKNISLIMQGPRRWALAGKNGAGKTTLLKLLLSEGASPAGRLEGSLKKAPLPFAYLDQQYSVLDPLLSVLDNVMSTTKKDLVEIRNQLAHFQFYGDKVHQNVQILSGGEKLKASLAKILLSDPAPQFLILDEPTNNLDLGSLEVLEEALQAYQGALLVVSHDEEFLSQIEVEEIFVVG